MKNLFASPAFKLFFVTLLTVPLGLTFAQNEALWVNIEAVNSKNFPHIEIETTVLDETGLPILGLSAENFHLEEDNLSVEVTEVQMSDRGIAVVLVMDTSDSMFAMPASRAAALAFVDALHPYDSVALIDFDTTVKELQPLSTNHDAVKTSIEETLEQGGRTALYDGTLAAVQMASQADIGRRVVILLADGNDSGDSVSGREAALTLAQAENIPIYTIGLGPQADRTYLENIAILTNGVYFNAPHPNDLTDLYTNLAERLHQTYLITYTSRVPGSNAAHRLVVEVEYENQTARATGNFASKELPPRVTVPPPYYEDGFLVVIPRVQVQGDGYQVRWYLDDDLLRGVDTMPPYAARLDPAQLEPGSYELRAEVVDAAGLSAVATRQIEVGYLPPHVEIQGLAEGAILADRPVELRLRVESQTEIQVVEFQINDEPPITLEAPPYRLEIDPLTLHSGEHTLRIRVENEGEAAFETVQNFSTTLQAPLIEFANLPVAPLTAKYDVNLRIEAQTDQYEVSWRLDGESIPSSEIPTQLHLDPFQLTSGVHQLGVTVTDERGLTRSITTQITIPALPPVLLISGLNQNDVLGKDPVTISLVITSQTEIKEVRFSLDDDPSPPQTIAPYRFEINPIALAQAEPSQHHLLVEVIDQTGETYQETLTFTVDLAPPALTLTGLPTEEAITQPFTLNLTVEAAADYSVDWRLDGESLLPRQLEDGYRVTIDPWDYPPQTYTMTIQVQDELGLSAEIADQTFTIAPLAPEVNLLGVSEKETLLGGRAVFLEIHSQSPLAEVIYILDEQTPINASIQAPYSHQLVPNEIGEGEHVLEVLVTDTTGQSTRQKVTFTVSPSAIQGPRGGSNNLLVFVLLGLIGVGVAVGVGVRFVGHDSPVKDKVVLKYLDPLHNKTVSYRIKKSETFIGRASGNDIVLLDPNTTISRQHAALKMSGRSWIIKDLDSHEGIFVNGKRIKDSQMLGNGDEIAIGPIKLIFIAPSVKVKTQDLAATRFGVAPDIASKNTPQLPTPTMDAAEILPAAKRRFNPSQGGGNR